MPSNWISSSVGHCWWFLSNSSMSSNLSQLTVRGTGLMTPNLPFLQFPETTLNQSGAQSLVEDLDIVFVLLLLVSCEDQTNNPRTLTHLSKVGDNWRLPTLTYMAHGQSDHWQRNSPREFLRVSELLMSLEGDLFDWKTPRLDFFRSLQDNLSDFPWKIGFVTCWRRIGATWWK